MQTKINSELVVTGARMHNLQNITVHIPKNTFTVMTGVSGSGKSSMAFDTIYAEGQRRYVESLSSYARQFLGIMDKPDVDRIDGLSPAIAIDQKTKSNNPRSTVGTVTEIYDYLRLLYARIGHPHCPQCGREIARNTIDQITDQMLIAIEKSLGSHPVFFFILSPVIRDRKGEFTQLFGNLRTKGFRMVRVDKTYYGLDEDIFLIRTNRHTVDCVIDRLSVTKQIIRNEELKQELLTRMRTSIEQAVTLSGGYVIFSEITDHVFSMPEKPKTTKDFQFSQHFSCPDCGISIPELEPRSFSFNSPQGACPTCNGLGVVTRIDPSLVFRDELSISEGGILPFAKTFSHDSWFSRIVTTAAASNGIDIKAQIETLSEEQKQILLFGTGDHQYDVSGNNRFGEKTVIHESFSGIIPELMRRYNETSSSWIREEIEKFMIEEICSECKGTRLGETSRNVTVAQTTLPVVSDFSITKAIAWISQLTNDNPNISDNEAIIAAPIKKELESRLGFLSNVGLEYLTLSRKAGSLSGGESQRIRLASQIGSGLSGVLYVLDEPSIGLHQRDNAKLITTLKNLRNLGNTVLVVEHDRDMMEAADTIIDFGPGAGRNGGTVVAQGTYADIIASKKSLTGQYLSNKKNIVRQKEAVDSQTPRLQIRGVTHHNLKDVTASIPLGKFVVITGVSGSGKSSLIVETLYPALEKSLISYSKAKPGPFQEIIGLEAIDKTILIDQSPIGRTPRSNPSTYTGLFTPIRELYAQTPSARSHGFTPGRFSFNMKGGRCEACEGEGLKKIEMQFLSDIYVTCEVCHGTRYNQETLDILFKDKSIADVLAMTVEEARDFFTNQPAIKEKLDTLFEVGLGYMSLGQSATTLSGGEAQRVKLATELSRRSSGKTLYILDEPTTGLHFADLDKLLHVLSQLVKKGNTVIVIEHNLDIIKNADWILDMGPGGGENGGKIIAQGTVGEIAKNPASITGEFLRAV